MAQGQAVHAQPLGADATGARTPDEQLRLIHQYERIVQFRDIVLAGLHPSVNLPPGIAAVSQSPSNSRDATRPPSESQVRVQSGYHQQAPGKVPPPSGPPTANTSSAVEEKKLYGSGSTEINPVLLEKSAELVKAELRLHRQRLERDIKAEVDQRRGWKQSKADGLIDFDIAQVFSRALELVPPTVTTPPADPSAAQATNDDAASDSFGDSTFYSSKHSTPEPRPASPPRAEPEGPPRPVIPGLHASQIPSAPRADREPVPSQPRGHEGYRNEPAAAARANPAQPYAPADHPSTGAGLFQVPGLNNYTNGYAAPAQTSQISTSAEQSQSEESSNAEPTRNGGYPARNVAPQSQSSAYVDAQPPSPMIRSHDMVPVAPQPAHYTAYAVDQQLERAVDQNAAAAAAAARGAPAPVAALRNEPITLNSPDSSPQSGKGSDKNKAKKKKKRKADRQAPEEVLPYIKPEPRSPSPIGAPNYLRPGKRQRRQPVEAALDGRASVISAQPAGAVPRPYQGIPMPVDYAGQPPRSASAALVGDVRYGGSYVEERRPLEETTYLRRVSPRYIQQPPPGAAYPPRPASQVYVDDGYREVAREPYDVARMSVRPDAGPYVGQPMPPPPPTRIYVDAYGREYIEPSRPPVRQSMAPAPHGPEVMYDRPLSRAVSRHPGPAAYDDGRGAVYARAASAYPGPRRVVTQPEYLPQDYRPREYSVRPPAPPTEYVQVMAPPAAEQATSAEAGAAAHEYAPRAASVRPPMEPVRYEAAPPPPPHGYAEMQPVRPAGYPPGRGYPEARQQPYVVEYGARPPAEQQQQQQPVYQHPGYAEQQYYAAEQRPPADNIAFIERPRGATQEIVYADDARREVYR